MDEALHPSAVAAAHLRKAQQHLQPFADETTPDGKEFTPRAKHFRAQIAAMEKLALEHDQHAQPN